MNTVRRVELLTLMVIAVVAGCHHRSTNSWSTVIPGSGVLAQEDRAVRGFSSVEFATTGSLIVEQGPEEKLRIRAEDNLLPYLKTEVQGGVLVLRTASGVDLRETQPIEFFLTVVDLERFVFSGVGDAEIRELVVDDLFLVSSGVGNIRLTDLDADRLDVALSGVALSGSGQVIASGQVDEQTVRVTGLGDYEAHNLASRVATLTLTSMGSATVRVSARLVATITGSGSVYYIGDPIVERRITGTGRVVKIG